MTFPDDAPTLAELDRAEPVVMADLDQWRVEDEEEQR